MHHSHHSALTSPPIMALVLFDKDGVSVRRQGPILTLLMNRGENRVNLTAVQLLHEALDHIEAAEGPKALVVASGNPKFFGNGLDLDWMMSSKDNPDAVNAAMTGFWKFLGRLLVLHCHTVAAIGGHAFGAGFFLALACDWRVMRTEKGFCNFPELNLGMRLSKPFAELAKAKCSPSALRSGVLMGKRFSSSSGIAAGVIDIECPVDSLLQKAEELALSTLPEALSVMRFDPDNFSNMKKELYTDAYRALTMGKGGEVPESRL